MMRPGYRSNRFRSKAERPLLLLFPGCCDDATASVMRIRKVQARGLPGNAAAAAAAASERGDSTSSAALGDESQLLPDAPAETDDAPSSRSPALQERSPTPPARPYMNLDEFVSSLARKNCFPDEETYHKTGESSGSLSNFFDDRYVDTSLRLAINPDPVRIKGGHVIDQQDDGRLQYVSTTTSARIECSFEAGKSPQHLEVFGESYQTTSIPEPEELKGGEVEGAEVEGEEVEGEQVEGEQVEGGEVEGEDGQPEQAMKSSSESMERRPRRTSRSTGRKREWSPEEDQEEDDDESSEHSSQRTKRRKRKRKKSEHSSVTLDHSSAKKAKTKKKPGGSSSRSGRPKKLKYMKQENTEELGNQCNRSDGKGWTCPLLAKTGYQLCDHHLDKLRCKPGSRSKYNKSKKKQQQQQQEQALP